MESAPEPRPRRDLKARFNELADNEALIPMFLFTLVLFAPPAVGWLVFGPPTDLLGWVVEVGYGFLAVAIFKGLVLGGWNDED